MAFGLAAEQLVGWRWVKWLPHVLDAQEGVSHIRVQFYDCLYTRVDGLFELTDAVLCADGTVSS